MRISRIYTDQPLENGHTIEISGDKARYLTQVLRLSVDHKVLLFNGRGGEFPGTICNIKKHSVSVTLAGFWPGDRASRLKISLGLGCIKRAPMELAIQKATELGVADIYPLITENTSIPLKTLSRRLTHWQAVAYSACEQSGLNRPPQVHIPVSLPQWIKRLDAYALKLVANIGARQSMLKLASQADTLIVAIGPEGGFTPEELALMQTAGFQPIGLGPRVLRTETAVIAMMSLAQAKWGDLWSLPHD